MSLPSPAHRDRGLRKVSVVTRLTAAGAAAVTLGLAVYVSGALPGASARAAPAPTTSLPTPTSPPVVAGPSVPSGTTATTAPPAPTAPRVVVPVVPVQPHTRTRGS
jgi:hypothetical protein